MEKSDDPWMAIIAPKIQNLEYSQYKTQDFFENSTNNVT